MRLDEITKDVFHRKLADPAAQELHEIAEKLEYELPQHSIEYKVTDDIAYIRFTFDRFSSQFKNMSSAMIEARTLWVVNYIKAQISKSDHWVWDTWDSKNGFRCFVIRK